MMGSGTHSRQVGKQRRAKALPAKGTSPRVKRQKRSGWQKKAAGLRLENSPSRVAGQHTLQEILSQPATWLETARQFRDDSKLVKIFQSFSSQEPWLFVACGSSYYLSQVIAAQWTKL